MPIGKKYMNKKIRSYESKKVQKNVNNLPTKG